MDQDFACLTKVGDLLLGSSGLWMVQTSYVETYFARRTAGGVLRLLTFLERYPTRMLAETAETPLAFVDDSTYPESPLLRSRIPNRRTVGTTPWPEPAPKDALLIVDTLNPQLWPAFQAWRGDRAAVVILEVDDHHGWFPPGVGHWVLTLSGVGAGSYHPPAPDDNAGPA